MKTANLKRITLTREEATEAFRLYLDHLPTVVPLPRSGKITDWRAFLHCVEIDVEAPNPEQEAKP